MMTGTEFVEIIPEEPILREERPAEAVHLALEFGYSLVSDTARYICSDGSDDICDGRVFALIHPDAAAGNEEILKFTFDDLGTADAVLGYSEGARQKLIDAVAKTLEEREGEEKAAWMRKQFVRLPADVPPWAGRPRSTRAIPISIDDAEQSLNDSGNAKRFETECAGALVCDIETKTWFAYASHFWKKTKTEVTGAARWVASTIGWEEVPYWQHLYDIERNTRTNNPDAKESALEKRLKKLISDLSDHARYSLNNRRIKDMVELAGETVLADDVTQKCNVNLLALKNGIYDTSTGVFYPKYQCEQFKSQYPIKVVDCTYTPGQRSVEFYGALLAMFTDNTTPGLSTEEQVKRSFQMAGYVMRILGYALLAGNPKQKIIILCGGSSNGKSLLMEVLAGILGNEFGRAPMKELSAVKEDKAAGGTAAGAGKRILYYPEGGGKDVVLSSAETKKLTDTYVIFREMHKDPKTQLNCCLPFISCNTFPQFDEVDTAIMRRVAVIPCLHRFVEGVDLDETLLDRLLNDRDAILSMLIDENILYHRGRPFTEDCAHCTAPDADKPDHCKTCHDRCKPGLLKAPAFCELDAVTMMAGGKYVYFINLMYEKTNKAKGGERIIRQDIADVYLEWCQVTKVEYKHDSHGGLAESERKGLYSAFSNLGFEEISSCGKRYFCCKRK